MDAKLQQQMNALVEKKSVEELTALLVKVGNEKGAKAQLRVADSMYQDHGGEAMLADEITTQQSHKIAQWGDKAFPLSEKQCRVIATAAKYQYKGA